MRFRFSTHLKTTWLFDTTAFYQRILNKPHLDFPVNLKRSNLKLSMTEIESNDKTTNFPSGKNTTTPFCIINDLTQSSFGPFVQSNKNTCFGFTETLILQFLSHLPFALFNFILQHVRGTYRWILLSLVYRDWILHFCLLIIWYWYCILILAMDL